MKANHIEPISDPKSTENRELYINLAMTKHSQSGGIRFDTSMNAFDAAHIPSSKKILGKNLRTSINNG